MRYLILILTFLIPLCWLSNRHQLLRVLIKFRESAYLELVEQCARLRPVSLTVTKQFWRFDHSDGYESHLYPLLFHVASLTSNRNRRLPGRFRAILIFSCMSL